MANELMEIPFKIRPFYQFEAIDRWKLDETNTTFDGTYDQLVSSLCDQHGFSTQRAQREVEEFIDRLAERVRLAADD